MSNDYSTWTDWAGDHPEQAEAEMRAEREKAERWAEHKRLAERSNIPDRDGADSAAMYAAERRAAEESFARVIRAGLLQPSFERTSCEHEDVDNQGVCANCGDAVEGWEPTDAQIFAQYGQTMEPRAAA